jgi:PAS domain S-box-containing protein
MDDSATAKKLTRPGVSFARRYGLAVASVATALGTTLILRYYNFPAHFISHFTLIAIAITFWCAGTGPGLLAYLLSSLGVSILARNHFLLPTFKLEAFLIFYAIFSLLMGWFSASRRRAERLLIEARNNLELRVAERTGELTRANEDLQNTQEAVRQSERELRDVVNSIPAHVWRTLPEGEVDFVNDRWSQFTGLALDQALGWKWEAVLHPDDRARVVANWQTALKNGQDLEYEARVRRADGEYCWWLIRNVPLRDEAGKLLRWYGTAIDIEDRKRAEQALRKSEERWRSVFENSAIGVALTDLNGRFLGTNHVFQAMVGYTEEELHAVSFLDITHEDYRQANWALITELLEGKRRQFQIEKKYLRKDGSSIWVSNNVSLVPGTERVPRFIMALSEDITQRKRAEEALQRSEAYLAEAQKLAKTGSWAYNPAAEKRIYWSDEMLRIFGLDPQSNLPDQAEFLRRVHPEDRDRFNEQIEKSRREKTDFVQDYRIVLTDGTVKHIHGIGHPVLDETGNIVEYVGTDVDVTERKRDEERLRRSEADLLEAQRLSHTGSWKHEIASGKVTVSPEVYRIFGVGPDEVTSTTEFWLNRNHPEDAKRIQELFEESEIQKKDYEADYRIVLPDGTIRHLHAVGHPVMNESGDLVEFIGTAIDVTEQAQARIELEKAFEEIERLKDRLHDENLALREQIDQTFMFEEIVGSSPALQTVLSSIVKVAPTDSTVLITGETGTGKELIARAIHKHSQRSGQAFISINCASIPSSLIASELFGHEKGAFTGAVQRRQGRFELAHSGTIFLDEVGELPAETQIALLRVLQERQFERVGGSRVLPTDVRVIAATNRDLTAAIAAGTFRSDLFYRLNVFPIEVPPLRKRKEDIPMLVEYFVKRYAEKAGKQIRKIDVNTLELCQSYTWPGNIRELQNIVERSVILASGDTFWVEKAWLASPEPARQELPGPLPDTLQNREREIIETALAACNGKVAGPEGAAAKLGIPRSTLDSKIKQLKIKKHKFISQ